MAEAVIVSIINGTKVGSLQNVDKKNHLIGVLQLIMTSMALKFSASYGNGIKSNHCSIIHGMMVEIDVAVKVKNVIMGIKVESVIIGIIAVPI